MVDIERPAPRLSLARHVQATLAFVGVGRLAVSAASVALVAAGCWWLLRAPAPPIERSLPFTAMPSSASSTTAASAPAEVVRADAPTTGTTPATIVVQAAGAVNAPGVYTLPGGARIHELITAAGGPVAGADTDALQLAAVLGDGQRVYVPVVGEVPAGSVLPVGQPPSPDPAAAPAAGPLDVNTATVEELDGLPGIGPATAAAIVAHRESNGPFGSVDDLLEVRGIGPAKLSALVGLVTT